MNYNMNASIITELDLQALQSFNYIFTVVRGIQAGREYYVTMCPLSLIPNLFPSNEENYLPVELRAQRILNKARISQITKYIINNPTEYVFPSLTISIESRVTFKSIIEMPDCKIGLLIVPMSARFIINDGQHRIAAIKEALRTLPKLGKETIPIIFFVDAGLKRSQQMFTDLNRYAVRPANSLNILYDHRDNIARLTMKVSSNIPIFKDRVEFEKTTLSPNSKKLFTLSNLYQAIKALLGNTNKVTREEENLCIAYWTKVSEYIREWRLLLEGKIDIKELRENFISVHGVTLHSLGIVGHYLLIKYPANWADKLIKLKDIDFSRSNKLWHGRTIVNGRISKAYINIILTSNLIKYYLGLDLSPYERRIEDNYINNKKVKLNIEKEESY